MSAGTGHLSATAQSTLSRLSVFGHTFNALRRAALHLLPGFGGFHSSQSEAGRGAFRAAHPPPGLSAVRRNSLLRSPHRIACQNERGLRGSKCLDPLSAIAAPNRLRLRRCECAAWKECCCVIDDLVSCTKFFLWAMVFLQLSERKGFSVPLNASLSLCPATKVGCNHKATLPHEAWYGEALALAVCTLSTHCLHGCCHAVGRTAWSREAVRRGIGAARGGDYEAALKCYQQVRAQRVLCATI